MVQSIIQRLRHISKALGAMDCDESRVVSKVADESVDALDDIVEELIELETSYIDDALVPPVDQQVFNEPSETEIAEASEN